MIDVKKTNDLYLSHFEQLERDALAGQPDWLLPVRKAAFARFSALGLPTTKHEEWRYTNVARIAATPFQVPDHSADFITPSDLAPFCFETKGCRLVFVNGRFDASLSNLGALADGVTVDSLAAAVKKNAAAVEPHLARHARCEDHAFAALNTALMQDGAFVHIAKGRIVASPIHLLYLSTASPEPTVCHPRNLIVLEENSQATIVETYAAIDDNVYFTNAVTEIIARENAIVDHCKIALESDRAFHIATLQIHQERASNVSSHAVSLGGALVRNNIRTLLDGEGAECTLNGLYFVSGDRHVDNHLTVVHAKPHCDSREFFKGILDDKSRGVFSGRIIVRKDAQKTDAKQTNQSMLLSPDAQIQSKPQLEILANDVKCTHGATVGQVNEQALFYLRSRGLTLAAARNLLVYAFAAESLEEIQIEPLRSQLNERLLERLPHGEMQQGTA